MLPVDEVGVAIARVYAKALIDLATAKGMAESVLDELDELVAYANGHSDFEQFLTSIVIDAEARSASLEKTLRGKVGDLVVDALQVLNRKGRLELLEEVCIQYRRIFETQRHQVEVTVTSAVPLGVASRESLLSAIKRRTGSEAILSERVDPSILGGLIVQIEDEKIDFSVSTRLRGFRRILLTRASHEIHGGRNYFEDV